MLRAMICLGGKNIREARVSDLLWPDAQGDSAHKTFEVTLIRLRKILGKSSIEYQGHLVTLNKQHCWVDVFALESLAAKAFGAWNEIGKNSAGRKHAFMLTSRALELSAGTFLPEDELPWVNSVRERVRSVISRLRVAREREPQVVNQLIGRSIPVRDRAKLH